MSLTEIPPRAQARLRAAPGQATLKSAFGVAVAMGVLGAGQAQALTISLYNSFNFGNSTYRTYLASQPIPWTTAYEYATGVTTTGLTGPALGGAWNLVSINSPAENAAIFNETDNPSLWNTPVGSLYIGPWIGLFQPNNNLEPAGGWRWVDGTLASYTNWSSGEPNNGLTCSNDTGVNNCDSVAAFFNTSLVTSDQWVDNSIGPTTFFVNGYPVSNPGALPTNYAISFVVEQPQAPGPLPIFGALATLGFSRKLRQRIKASKTIRGASITTS